MAGKHLADKEGNFEFDLDLTSFEANQKAAYLDRGRDYADGEDEIDYSSFGEQAPWEDTRSFDELYSVESQWKGKLLIQGDKVEQINDHSWSVQGTSQYYVVRRLETPEGQIPWLTCDCPNGNARGGRPSCYHSAAVHELILGIDLDPIHEPPAKSARKRPASG